MTTLYGIPNCDTIKKARRWLENNGIEYQFHDYKKAGIDAKTLKAWCKIFGHEALVNKRGTTWRKLDEKVKSSMDENTAIDIMIAQPSIIKRPVLINAAVRILGFDEDEYKSLL